MILSQPNRIFSIDEAAEHLEELKRHGKTIVLANGAFDLLHVGHLRYLEGARAHGDFLVVAVNSDRSVRRLKGCDRPIIPSTERAELIAGLRVVDLVVLFDALTVNGILERFQPHVHAKGTDYTPDTVPEKDTVQRYGGRTVIAGDPKSHSSSRLLRRLQADSPTPQQDREEDGAREEEGS